MQLETIPLVLPPLDHIGIVVKETGKTAEFLSSMGVPGPWKTSDFSQNKDVLLIGEPFKIRVTFAKVGSVVFELLQPLEGNSVWAQFLETNGEGLHHIAFSVANFDDWVSKAQAAGAKMITGGRSLIKQEGDRVMTIGSPEGNRWCYLYTEPGGTIIEFIDNLMGLAPVC